MRSASAIPEEDFEETAQKIGIAALKYADLSQNRESDYVFSYDKMLALNGNTATYMQYAYARVRSIFSRGGFDAQAISANAKIQFTHPSERALAMELLRFDELDDGTAAAVLGKLAQDHPEAMRALNATKTLGNPK